MIGKLKKHDKDPTDYKMLCQTTNEKYNELRDKLEKDAEQVKVTKMVNLQLLYATLLLYLCLGL